VEPVKLLGTEQGHSWEIAKNQTNLFLIRDIDEEAMKCDFFQTLEPRYKVASSVRA